MCRFLVFAVDQPVHSSASIIGMGVMMIQELMMPQTNKPNTSNRSKTSRATKTATTARSTSRINPVPLYAANPAPAKQAPCYLPFCLSSQSGHSHVLYYNANAPADELFDCATARMQAVINLMESLFEYNNAKKSTVPSVATVSAYLLNDAMTLLQELNPLAIKLKKESAD